jgi:putative restriction endonuclease
LALTDRQICGAASRIALNIFRFLQLGYTRHMAEWTRQRLLDQIRDLNVWEKAGERAPHKPLLVLYSLGKLACEGQPSIRFHDFYQPFKNLLQEFGPPRKSYHPEYPFWYLQTEQFWEIRPQIAWPKKKGGSSPTKSELELHDAVGSFVPEVQRLLLGEANLLTEVASILLNGHFPDSIHEDVLVAVNLDQVQVIRPKRDPRFRENVLRTYGYRCAVCAFDLRLDHASLALDAAHIRWHQAQGPSTMPNGLALCALHHKLFDRGAFTLADDLTLVISARVNGSTGLIEHLIKFQTVAIAMPNLRTAKPDLSYVQWHRTEVFHEPARDWANVGPPIVV